MNITKKIISFMMLMAIAMPSTSQSLRDYIRSRAGNSDSLIINAVTPALSLIRQQYRLERNGDFYGKNKKAFYGETYTLGVKIAGGTIMLREVIFPWENDEDYKRVNAGGKYRPALFRSMQHGLTENGWRSVDLELGTQYTTPFTADSLLYRHTDATSDFGLPLEESLGSKRGYMIWAYSITNLQDSTMSVKLQTSAISIELKSDSTSILNPESTENLLGGLFVIPVVERPGYIKILLAGVAAKVSQKEWQLKPMIASNNVTNVDEVKKTDKQKKKKKEKAVKESDSESVDDIEPTLIK